MNKIPLQDSAWNFESAYIKNLDWHCSMNGSGWHVFIGTRLTSETIRVLLESFYPFITKRTIPYLLYKYVWNSP